MHLSCLFDFNLYYYHQNKYQKIIHSFLSATSFSSSSSSSSMKLSSKYRLLFNSTNDSSFFIIWFMHFFIPLFSSINYSIAPAVSLSLYFFNSCANFWFDYTFFNEQYFRMLSFSQSSSSLIGSFSENVCNSYWFEKLSLLEEEWLSLLEEE